MNCPRCNAPATDAGQPSKRQFYACGSYGYGGELAATELCIVQAERNGMRDALIRLRDCDWVITPHDRMDAVRAIARAALGNP